MHAALQMMGPASCAFPVEAHKWEGNVPWWAGWEIFNPSSKLICSVALHSSCLGSYYLNSSYSTCAVMLTPVMLSHCSPVPWPPQGGWLQAGSPGMRSFLTWYILPQALLRHQGGPKPRSSITRKSCVSCFRLYNGELQPCLSCGCCYKLVLSDLLHCTLILQGS